MLSVGQKRWHIPWNHCQEFGASHEWQTDDVHAYHEISMSISKSCNFEAVSITSVFKLSWYFLPIPTITKIRTMSSFTGLCSFAANAHYTDVVEIFLL